LKFEFTPRAPRVKDNVSISGGRGVFGEHSDERYRKRFVRGLVKMVHGNIELGAWRIMLAYPIARELGMITFKRMIISVATRMPLQMGAQVEVQRHLRFKGLALNYRL
jgi:hypothetical protein